MKPNGLAVIMVGFSLLACDRREAPALPLPGEMNAHYTILVRTYHGDYGDQPFELLVSTQHDLTEPARIFFAEQCRNVAVAQTPSLLYIFYDELAIRDFHSFSYGSRPRPLLCDLAISQCRQMRDDLARRRVNLRQICTLRTAYSRP